MRYIGFPGERGEAENRRDMELVLTFINVLLTSFCEVQSWIDFRLNLRDYGQHIFLVFLHV